MAICVCIYHFAPLVHLYLLLFPTPLISAIDITHALIDGRDFNIMWSLLSGSGVLEEIDSEKDGAGITLFAPTDDAFVNIPDSTKFQSLPSEQKINVLRFHVVLSYYPLAMLESIVNPSQPTLATEDTQPQMFTLKIASINGSVGISSGLVDTNVTRTVVDENPIAIYAISSVLLPKEIFGNKDMAENVES